MLARACVRVCVDGEQEDSETEERIATPSHPSLPFNRGKNSYPLPPLSSLLTLRIPPASVVGHCTTPPPVLPIQAGVCCVVKGGNATFCKGKEAPGRSGVVVRGREAMRKWVVWVW